MHWKVIEILLQSKVMRCCIPRWWYATVILRESRCFTALEIEVMHAEMMTLHKHALSYSVTNGFDMWCKCFRRYIMHVGCGGCM